MSLTALTLTIDLIVRRVDLITHPGLVIVMHSLVQALVILQIVTARCHLILVHILVCRPDGSWARLVF